MTDIDLINKVKNELDSDALKELVNRHTGLYMDILNKYSYVPEVEKNDFKADKTYNIYQYALDYNPDKNMKFSVYMGQRLKWECIGTIVKAVDSEEITPEVLVEDFELPDKDTVKFIVDNTKEITDKRFFKVFKMRHLQEKPASWSQIGKSIGMTHEGARKIYLHNIEFLRNRIKRENLIST